jgi:hypothetical protein
MGHVAVQLFEALSYKPKSRRFDYPWGILGYFIDFLRRSMALGSTQPLTEMSKVKQSRNRPGLAQSVPGILNSQISWHSACESGEFVSLTLRPPLPPRMFLVLIFTWAWDDPRVMVRSEGNMSLKNPVTWPRIDPGAVRLVAQRLSHYATPGPNRNEYQACFLGGKGGRCLGLTILPLALADSRSLFIL